MVLLLSSVQFAKHSNLGGGFVDFFLASRSLKSLQDHVEQSKKQVIQDLQDRDETIARLLSASRSQEDYADSKQKIIADLQERDDTIARLLALAGQADTQIESSELATDLVAKIVSNYVGAPSSPEMDHELRAEIDRLSCAVSIAAESEEEANKKLADAAFQLAQMGKSSCVMPQKFGNLVAMCLIRCNL